MHVSLERCNISLTHPKQRPEVALTPHTSFYLYPSFPETKRGSSGQIKFRIVLDSVMMMMMVGMVSVSLAEVTHEREVVGGHEVAEASKSSRPASDRNTEPRLRIKPHTLFLISCVSECGNVM